MSDFIRKLPYTPIALGAAVYLLTGGGPDAVRNPLLDRLRASLSSEQITNLIDFLRKAFITTAAFDAVYYTNSFLNNLAHNNFRSADTSRWNWPEEIAVITGGASGLGKGFAEQLASRGVHVVVLDVSAAQPETKSGSKGRITHFKCDVTNADEVKEVATKVKETIGHPSILINNAGIARNHSIMKTSPQELQAIMGVNIMSHWYTVHEFLPHMVEKKKGHIVTIASMASFIAAPGMVDYAVTKAAALAFHEGLSSELRAYHQCPQIHTTVVHPTWTATPMVEKYRGRLERAHQRIIDPKDVINPVVNQILSCKGGQLVIGPAGSIIRRLRFFPKWFSGMLFAGLEKGTRKSEGLE